MSFEVSFTQHSMVFHCCKQLHNYFLDGPLKKKSKENHHSYTFLHIKHVQAYTLLNSVLKTALLDQHYTHSSYVTKFTKT